MEYLITFYNSYEDVTEDFIDWIVYYIEQQTGSKPVHTIYTDKHSSCFSVVLNDLYCSKVLIEKLSNYLKAEVIAYIIDTNPENFITKHITDKDTKFVGEYVTDRGVRIPYVSCYDHIMMFTPTEYDDYYYRLHDAVYYHYYVEKNKRNYPHIRIVKPNNYLYFCDTKGTYVRPEVFSREDIFQILKIKPTEHILWDKFYLETLSGRCTLKYDDEDVVVTLSELEINEGEVWGTLNIRYRSKRPFRTPAYTTKEPYGEYFKSFTINNFSLTIKAGELTASSVNFHQSYWLTLLGGILEERGEEAIPKCFNPKSILPAYREFQTYETLYHLKNS